MTLNDCYECGASYERDDDSCTARFGELLALDHSRREPWGSRHGQAFAAFALQHPTLHATSLDATWSALYRIYCLGVEPAAAFAALRNNTGGRGDSDVPERPAVRSALPALTIADLDHFAAETYADRLDAWCQATLRSWGVAEIDRR